MAAKICSIVDEREGGMRKTQNGWFHVGQSEQMNVLRYVSGMEIPNELWCAKVLSAFM